MSILGTTWQKVSSTNITTTGFTASYIAPAAAADVPTAAVIDIKQYVGTIPDNLMLQFFGAGSDNQTYDVRVIGWALSADATTYIPTVLAVLTCTLSATVGATDLLLVSTDRLVDTITLATGFNAGVIVDVTSPTGDVPGHILLDSRGFSKIQLDFDMTGATNGNAIYRNVEIKRT